MLVIGGVAGVHLGCALPSKKRLERFVDERGVRESRTQAAGIGQENGVDRRAEPCAGHATIMPRRQERDHGGAPAAAGGLSPHALRRSFASWLIAEGQDVAYVMDQLGHTDPSMPVGIYARAIRNGRRSACSRRRLEALAVDADRAATGTDAAATTVPAVVQIAD
jgi:hypothetical protein